MNFSKNGSKMNWVLARLTAIGAVVAASFAANAAPAQPDALLQIDMNRIGVVDRIVNTWQNEIAPNQAQAFRSKLMSLRADQLLAANLSGSFDGVLEMIYGNETRARASSAQSKFDLQTQDNARDMAKAAGELLEDLVYTPIIPCRFIDTRGVFSPVFAGGAYSAGETRSYQAAGNCGVPVSAKAVVTQIIMITPPAAGDIEVLPKGATFGGTVAMVFQQGVFSSVSLTTRLSGTGEFATQIRGQGGNVAMDITGYFMPPSRTGDGLRVVRSATGTIADNPVPNVINGDNTNDVGSVLGSIHGATVSGGYNNIAGNADGTTGNFSTIGGGRGNRVGNSTYPGGGGDYTTIAGGFSNIARDYAATVGGGEQNYALGTRSTISGGTANEATGYGATVPGGEANVATGNYSFAAGRSAKADAIGQFVWSDTVGLQFNPVTQGVFADGTNTFAARARGGVSFVNGVDINTGAITAKCTLTSNASSWNCTSDRNMKEHIQAISARSVLDKLMSVPVTTWNMIGSKEKQLGPMAQDFFRAFGLGSSDTTINTTNAQGVAFAAIQGLNEKLSAESKAKDKKIAALEKKAAELDTLKSELAAIKKRLGL